MKLLLASLMAASAAAFAPSSFQAASKTALSETTADLESLAGKLNPIVKFYDPLGLSDRNFWGTSDEASIGWLRESEVKHGRIAMFAFVGYIVHANGITFPWPMTLAGDPFPKVSSAPEAWDAIPDGGKLQIMAFVGFLEFWSEANRGTHYMKGGKVGDFPDFDSKYIPGGALNLYDPFGWHKSRTEEEKANGLLKEINNGRLAMLGIFGFLSEGAVEGSVPALKGVIPHYSGEVMAPFTKSILPSF
eukprot:CAMPEP_0195520116 /NCGR_PEP_ID=MMETSP0794_2-20130614/16171_1 /TAXON_ID=515487 /ORGANISM="Stephanopyxis turris, Strain CCMP 815" /LENGTH=246 /DNA_ID=CAMNT_0040649401 /DNA_START=51 /DNA_END=791 /DNA_ORIENTATION=-